MNVFVVMYGNLDTDDECFRSVHSSETSATEAAKETVQEILKDAYLLEEGYRMVPDVDSNGNNVVSIFNPNDQEIEWWIVREVELHG